MLGNYRNIHFIGIGGSGMSAIALILLKMGFRISGSDLKKTDMTEKLEQLGAQVFLGHRAENVNTAEAVVISTAIPAHNPELYTAREKGLQIFHRADIVAAIMKDRFGIAVAGAHGKTTTTSMIAIVLEKAGLDPTVIIGGEVDDFGGNAKLGHGSALVAEADESDGSFLKLSPLLAVVTNIENDHMDYYRTMDNLLHTFEEFLRNLPETDGCAIVCMDSENVRKITANYNRSLITYAVGCKADFVAQNIRTKGIETSYDVYHGEQCLGTVALHVPGAHNVSNSLAAVVVGLQMGLDFKTISSALFQFHGAKRRFQTKGTINGVWVVDDYGHHPTEISTTLKAARQTDPNRLICVFQPHRYSRTQLLHEEFGKAFSDADIVVLTDVYAAGERSIPGIDGQLIERELQRQGHQQVIYIPDRNEIASCLADMVKPGDLVVTMGAGNIDLTGEELIRILSN